MDGIEPSEGHGSFLETVSTSISIVVSKCSTIIKLEIHTVEKQVEIHYLLY